MGHGASSGADAAWAALGCVGKIRAIGGGLGLKMSQVVSGRSCRIKHKIHLSVEKWARKENERMDGKKVDKARVKQVGTTRSTEIQFKVDGIFVTFLGGLQADTRLLITWFFAAQSIRDALIRGDYNFSTKVCFRKKVKRICPSVLFLSCGLCMSRQEHFVANDNPFINDCQTFSPKGWLWVLVLRS